MFNVCSCTHIHDRGGHVCTIVHCAGQRTIYMNHLTLSTMWGSGTELRLAGLVARAVPSPTRPFLWSALELFNNGGNWLKGL